MALAHRNVTRAQRPIDGAGVDNGLRQAARKFLLPVGGCVCKDQVEDLAMSELDRKQLEKKLREHPLVAARLKHARDTHAAEAAVRECIYGEPITISSWLRSSTYQQVKLAYSQITK